MRLVTGLNGKQYKWNLNKYNNSQSKNKSQFHLKARLLIHEIYGNYPVLEEVKLPGSSPQINQATLFLDFFIPTIDLAIEVHGAQHYEYIPFFHKNKMGFAKSLVRDNDKIQWCLKNDIDLVILKYSEDINEWTRQLRERD